MFSDSGRLRKSERLFLISLCLHLRTKQPEQIIVNPRNRIWFINSTSDTLGTRETLNHSNKNTSFSSSSSISASDRHHPLEESCRVGFPSRRPKDLPTQWGFLPA